MTHHAKLPMKTYNFVNDFVTFFSHRFEDKSMPVNLWHSADFPPAVLPFFRLWPTSCELQPCTYTFTEFKITS